MVLKDYLGLLAIKYELLEVIRAACINEILPSGKNQTRKCNAVESQQTHKIPTRGVCVVAYSVPYLKKKEATPIYRPDQTTCEPTLSLLCVPSNIQELPIVSIKL